MTTASTTPTQGGLRRARKGLTTRTTTKEARAAKTNTGQHRLRKTRTTAKKARAAKTHTGTNHNLLLYQESENLSTKLVGAVDPAEVGQPIRITMPS